MAIRNKLIRHKIFVERYATSVANRAQNIIDEARNYILGQLNAGNTNVDQIRTNAERILMTMKDSVFAEIEDFMGYEQNFLKDVLNKALKTELNEVSIPSLFDAFLAKSMPVGLSDKKNGRSPDAAFNAFVDKKAKQLTQPLRDAELNGEDRFITGEKIAALAAGIVAIQTGSLVKTAVTHSEIVAKDSLLKENKEEFDGVEWVSVLDSRTTDYCKSQDGKTFDLGQGPRPPAHYNCRSITMPVGKGGKRL